MNTRQLYQHPKGDAEGFWACDLYSCNDAAETLSDSEPDEAIESYFNGRLSARCDVLVTLKEAFGDAITVYGYTRRRLDAGYPDPATILERVLEDLDEEYGGGDDPSEITPAMTAAVEAFVAVIRSEYVVWQCEQIHRAVVNIEAWVREYRPDWLEPVS